MRRVFGKFAVWVLVASAMVLSTRPAAGVAGDIPLTPDGLDGASVCTERVLFVAGSSPAPHGDASLLDAVEQRFPGLDCVDEVADDDVTVSQAESFDAVVISSSVHPAVLGDRLVDAAVPVLVSEPHLFDDMAMVSPGANQKGELPGRTSIWIADPDHPLAAGLAGTVKIFETAAGLNWGSPWYGQTAATVGPRSGRSTIFGFPIGNRLQDGRYAAQARVGFPVSYGARLTDQGRALVHTALDWLGGAVPTECGQVITADLVLVQDLLDCPADGLVVGADGIIIDLNGHALRGVGRAALGTGVVVNGHDDVTIRNGTIENFHVGVGIGFADSTVVEDVNANDHQIAVDVGSGTSTIVQRVDVTDAVAAVRISHGSGNTVRDVTGETTGWGVLVYDSDDNHLVGNTLSGGALHGVSVASGADGNTIAGNVVTGFGSSGVFLENNPDLSADNLIEDNTATGNGENGIFVAADVERTTIRANTANSNAEWGIRALGTVVDGGFNSAMDNGAGGCVGVVCSAESSPRALFVSGSTPPPPGDTAILERVTAAGVTPTVVDDDGDLAAIDTGDYDVVLISTSVVPSKVGATFKNAPVPVIVWEGYLFDDMALSASGETTKLRTDVTVTDPFHSLAAGFGAGKQRVYQTAQKLSYGVPAPGAEVVAHEPGRSNRAVIFAYHPGDDLVDGTAAPALRVALFPTYLGAQRLAPGGIGFVDAAIGWVLAGGSPINDDFAQAFPLRLGTNYGNSIGATLEPGEPGPVIGGWSPDVASSLWWTWTAPTDGVLTLDEVGSEGDSTIVDAVWSGASLGELTLIAASDDHDDPLSADVEGGRTYHVAVYDDGYPITRLRLQAGFTPAPANDDFADRAPLDFGVHVGDNRGATLQPDEPVPTAGQGVGSLWWTWTTPFDGTFVFDAAGSDMGTVLSLWSGDDLATLVEVVSTDDTELNSRIQLDLTAGTTYQLAVAGLEGTSWVALDGRGVVQVNVLGAELVDSRLLADTPLADWVPSWAIGADSDGRPAVLYSSRVDGEVQLVICTDVRCEGDDLPVPLDVTPPGFDPLSLLFDDELRPLVLSGSADHDADVLVRCNDPLCEGDDESETVLPTPPDGFSFAAMKVAPNGRPAIAYSDGSSLWLVRCKDDTCARPAATVQFDIGGHLTALEFDGGGAPVMLSHETIPPQINTYFYTYVVRLARCSDPTCGTVSVQQIAQQTWDSIGGSGLTLDPAGNPTFILNRSGYIGSSIQFVRCTDRVCAGERSTTTIDGNDFQRGNFVEVGGAGFPVIGVNDWLNEKQLVAFCRDVDCEVQSLLKTRSDRPYNVAAVVDGHGDPIFVYEDGTETFGQIYLTRTIGLRM